MYTMIYTRPSVSCSLSMTSRYKVKPGENNWIAVKNILKYPRKMNGMFLVRGNMEELSVKAYIDASF